MVRRSVQRVIPRSLDMVSGALVAVDTPVLPESGQTHFHVHSMQVRKLAQRGVEAVRHQGGKVMAFWYRNDRKYGIKWRVANLTAASLILASALIPVLTELQSNHAYALSADALKLVGQTDTKLSSKLTYDSQKKLYQFNKDAVKAFNPADALRQQVGQTSPKDKSLYSLDVHEDMSKGVKYYDINSQLNFSMVPQFKAQVGKIQQGHLVYPIDNSTQAIYTLKNNGLKEDIVVSKATDDSMRFVYTLNLPKTLEARALPNGNGAIGIYSASPTLFGNITTSTPADEALIQKAREKGAKDTLVFGIPAPVITKSADDKTAKPTARFELRGSQLTVVAEHLSGMKQPFSIDPSVVITSTSDFATGNNEGNINFSTANQIGRGGLTGGGASLGWVQAGANSGLVSAQYSLKSVVWNGKVYVFGESTNQLYYSSISGGVISGWTTARNATNTADTPAYPVGTNNHTWGDTNYAVYNGYIYAFGGSSGSGGSTLPIQLQYVAQIDSSGNVPAWTVLTTATQPSARYAAGVTAYNGSLYVVGGCTSTNGLTSNCSNGATDTWKATIKADGTLVDWVQQSSATPSANMNTSLFAEDLVAYNGYLYAIGGCIRSGVGDNCDNRSADVSVTKINTDGTITTVWTSTAAMLLPRLGEMVAYNGYMYVVSGCNIQNCNGTNNTDTDVEYASINANGTLGAWQTTTYSSTGGPVRRALQAVFADGGYLYQVGGCLNNAAGALCSSGGSQVTATSISAKIDDPGVTGSYSTPANYDSTARTAFNTTAYGGYIYVIGGSTSIAGGSGAMVNTVRYAPVNADGSLGVWATASTGFANVTTESGMYCTTPGNCSGRTNMAAGAFGGYLYIAGGWTNTGGGGGATNWSDVQSAVICTGSNVPVSGCTGAGDLRSWTTASQNFVTNGAYANANGRARIAMQIYNGKMYLMGGYNDIGATGTVYQDVYYATLTSSGGLSSFTSSSVSLPSARSGARPFVANGMLYIVGGGGGGSWTSEYNNACDVQFIPINPDGSLDGTTGWKDANAVINGGSGSSFAAANANQDYAVSLSNGYVYVTGGQNGAAAASTFTTVYKAKINTNGSLSSWATTTSFTNPRYDHGSIAYNGYLYVIGGCKQLAALIGNNCVNAASMLTDYQYAQINNGGSGTTGAWAASSNNGSGAIGGYTSYNGYIYNIRGCNGSLGVGDLNCDNLSTGGQGMTYAAVNADGSFGSWQTLSSTGTPLGRAYGLSAVAYNGYLYVVGGCTTYASSTCTVMSKQVYYAPINSNGDVGTWATTTDFDASSGRYGLSAVAYNGYLYVVGGCTATLSGNCTAYENTVRMAQIGSNGTVGAWGSAGSNFSGARFWQSAVAYNNKLYVLGGCTAMVTENCTGLQNDVQMISLNSNGSLSGSWKTTSSFNTPRSAFGAVAYNGYLYVVGGCAQFNTTGGNCLDYKNDIQYAPISASGDVGTWNKSVTSMTNATLGHGLVVSRGYLITLFGIKATHTYESVSRISPIQVIPRIGQYSKLIDFGVRSNVRGISYSGNLPGALGSGGGLSQISYNAADTTGAYIANGSAAGGALTNARCTGINGVRYLFLSAILDDSQSGVFPDSNGTAANITDISVLYEPSRPPQIRLRLGQTLQQGSLSDLDICKI